ncbi:glycosyltransferase [Flavicella marina]|uniref:glycosyltransferase n=1 Tax=Flavicella marina TaxID=1475951 RepID=UPI0012657314|nr:glycosyltransferase [Flavicella marina]
MKISNIVSSIDLESGGPSRSVTHLIKYLLANKDCFVELHTLESDNPVIRSFEEVNARLSFYPSSLLGVSKKLKDKLINLDVDIFHGHGLWEMPVNQMSNIARKRGIPYIITPRGMLESWSLSQGKIKKQLALSLFQYNDLKNAVCLHATAPMEVESIRQLGLKNPIAMIPNGIQLEEFSVIPPQKSIVKKKILFLSRIHVKKGIENLIDAWLLIDDELRKDWCIDIIGNGEVQYIESLRLKIKKGELDDQIFIKSPVFDKDKIDVFREANLFVLPTYSENFGIVIAEALASYTPVITTKGAPWEDLNKNNCGWWIDLGVEPLKQALVNALETDQKKLNEMGVNGRSLIEKKYSMQSIAKQMVELYNWVLKTGPKPKFVEYYD